VDPAMLVLDEPFASLDQSLATTLGVRIADRVRRRGTLVVLSTHDIDQALAMSTRMLVIAGEPASLVEDISVPTRDDETATAGLRQNLLSRFSFLGRGGS
jgi:ABC-type nitrate/sulfonate/bicarbonate transport system ATPase subunit